MGFGTFELWTFGSLGPHRGWKAQPLRIKSPKVQKFSPELWALELSNFGPLEPWPPLGGGPSPHRSKGKFKVLKLSPELWALELLNFVPLEPWAPMGGGPSPQKIESPKVPKLSPGLWALELSNFGPLESWALLGGGPSPQRSKVPKF